MFRKYAAQIILLLLTLAGWIFLSYYNVLVDDDLVMLKAVKQGGILEATIGHYTTWNTRWMSFFFLHCWMTCWNEESSLFFYHLFTLIVLLYSSHRMVKAMTLSGWICTTSPIQGWLFAGFLSAALITGTFHIGDTWFWVNTSTMYGWNLIVILFAMSLTLLPVKSPVFQNILMTFLGLYTGGASEPAVACLLLILPLILLSGKKISDAYKPHILNFLIGMSVSFAIALAGEGHGKRDAALPDLAFQDWILKSAYFSAKIAFYHSPLRLLLMFMLVLPVFSNTENLTSPPPRKTLLYASVAWLMIVTIHTSFITFIMGDYGPERSWSFISFFSLFMISWCIRYYPDVIPPFLIKFSSWGAVMLVAAVLIIQVREIPFYSDYVRKVKAKEILYDPTSVPRSGLLHRITMVE